jgi:competence protein ComEC
MRPDSSIHWSAYPALLGAVAFAVGIGGRAAVGTGGPLLWSGGVGAGVAGFAALQWWDRRRLVTLAPLGRVGVALLLVASAGAVRHAAYEVPSPRSLAPVADAAGDPPLVLGGVVQDAPERSDASTRFTMAADTAFGEADTTAVDGRVRVTLRPSPWRESTKAFPRVHQGDRVRLQGSLRRPPGQRNPGGFDYAAYLSRRGVCCTMYVGTPADVSVVDRDRDLRTALVVDVRRYVRGQIRRYVPSENGRAVLQALLLGDRSRITDAQRSRFAQTGLMHLLAVSGLHVFLVGMVLYVLLRPLLMRIRLSWTAVEVGRAVLTVGVLGGYMLLTGARPSVVRAVIMSSLLIGGVVFQRSSHPLNTLGVAALVLLAVRPPALFDAGFQLSMAAVAGIVTLNPRFLDAVPERYRTSSLGNWGVSMVTVSAAATLGTAPVLLFHFGWVSIAGLLLNVVGIPCTGLALSAAVAMELVGGVWPLAAAAFGSTSDLFVRGLLLTSRWGAEWVPWAGLRVATPGVWTLGALAAGMASLAQWPRPRLRWRWMAVALFLATAGVWASAVKPAARPTLDVLFFDVGQGDAALVSTPEGKHILVDTGPRSFGGESAAAHSILPYLDRHGIDHLEAVVVTHPDGDHLGGLPSLLQSVSVGQVLHSGQRVQTDLYERSRTLLKRNGIPNRAVDRGDGFSLGAVRVQVLGPPARPRRHGIESENGRSVVLHLTYGATSVLLPGDIESDAERDLARTYGSQLESQVVKVPHHGSATSSTSAFVDSVADSSQSTMAVVSVGKSNQFGMPDAQVLDRWRNVATIHRTSETGAVWLRSDGRAVWQVRWE